MMAKLKRAAPYLAAGAAGVVVGLALASTAFGVKASAKIAALRAKAGI